MKIVFSTLGCPGWTFDEIITTAKDLGYYGIEIRGIGDEIYAPKIKEFLPENIAGTKEKLARLKLKIEMLTSDACLSSTDEKEMTEAFDYLNLAKDLGVRHVRVLGTVTPWLSEGDFAVTLKNYEKLCLHGEKTGVTPLIESNGMFCDTDKLKTLMENVKSENKGVLWDIHHPYRYNKEIIYTTILNIGKYIKYVHIKDSLESDGQVNYKLLGQGDLPLKTAISALKKLNYNGPISLEWVKRWDKTLEDAGVVFHHFISTVKNFL